MLIMTPCLYADCCAKILRAYVGEMSAFFASSVALISGCLLMIRCARSALPPLALVRTGLGRRACIIVTLLDASGDASRGVFTPVSVFLWVNTGWLFSASS